MTDASNTPLIREYQDALDRFSHAASELLDTWWRVEREASELGEDGSTFGEDIRTGTMGSTGYPFDTDFHDVVLGIAGWRGDIRQRYK